jgi:hypothetical protein
VAPDADLVALGDELAQLMTDLAAAATAAQDCGALTAAYEKVFAANQGFADKMKSFEAKDASTKARLAMALGSKMAQLGPAMETTVTRLMKCAQDPKVAGLQSRLMKLMAPR